MCKPVARRAVHNDDDNEISTRQRKRDDIGFFGIIPNEPKTTKQHSHSNVGVH